MKIMIIGAGQAGAQAAISLRQAKFDGEILMIGAETHPPYQRPPLSKAYVEGKLESDRLWLRPEEFYLQQNITLALGERVTQIDTKAKTVYTDKEAQYLYDRLLIATGAPPRPLPTPGAELSGIHYLRTLDDSETMKGLLTTTGRVVIVGAGYIGLEVAAVLRKAGRDVTVLEMAERPLARVASPPVSQFFQNLHTEAGVDIRLNTKLEKLVGENGQVSGAVLESGELVECSAVLAAIGAVPETAVAEEAGLDIENGIKLDEFARTSNENIWAAGDCASFPSPRYGRRLRLESVPNAIEQAKIAALNMLGEEKVHDALPWFWSDQYDVKFQSVGLSEGYDSHVIRKTGDKKLAVWYLKDGAAIAVDCINDPISFGLAKRIIPAATKLDTQSLADPDFDLKQFL